MKIAFNSLCLFALLSSASLVAQNTAPETNFFFLDPASLDTAVIPPPPAMDPQQQTDTTIFLAWLEKRVMKDPLQKLTASDDLDLLHYMMQQATPEQIAYAMNSINDSVFDYAQVLGSHFNAQECPITAAFFDNVTNDINNANFIAKNIFQHPHPPTWIQMSPDDNVDGYSYPSDHTTRAYVWAKLLSHPFSKYQKELFKEASQKAWSRVRIGRHYPSDIDSGELYASYLVKKLSESSEFQQEWLASQQEMTRNIPE